MQIDLNKLEINKRFTYDDDFTIDLNTYHNDNIKDLKDLHLTGYIYYNSAEILEINLNVTGVMIIYDAVTLDDIEEKIDIKIDEEYSLNDKYFQEYYEKGQNILDIIAILWENIVLEVPISKTCQENLHLKGEGWQLGNDENQDKIDPRMAKLAALLGEGKE